MTPKRILVADDSTTVQLMYRMLLADGPWSLSVARNGREAVEKALADAPHLIFLDVMMPELDGFAACRQLRAHGATRKTPIIIVTTRGEPHHVELGYQCGCTDYVAKPFSGPELLAKVHSNLATEAP